MEDIKTFLKDMYDVRSDVIGHYGNWVVTSDGDIINYEYAYPIYSYQVNDNEWLAQLRTKTWFNKKIETCFLEAFEAACSVLGVKVDLKESY